jgi:hypothetical protein
VKRMRTRSRVGVPKRRCGSNLRPLPLLRLVAASFVVLAGGFQEAGAAEPIQQPKGNEVIVGTVVDEHHVPVARAQVQAFSAEDVRKASKSSQHLGRSTESASTDETGSFRISGLPAVGVALAEGDHDVVVFVAPREAPKPTIDNTQASSALVEQFKDEKVFWKQIDIAKAIAGKHDASVLTPLADWLDHQDRHIRGNVAFIFASFGDPRGLRTIADILADRSERPEGQGIPIASSDGRYRFERQVASDRYYAAHLLGDLRDPRGTALLVPLLDDPETQSIAPWSLAQIGDMRAIPPLIDALDNDDPSNRVLVIYALEALHAKEAVPRLLTLVNDDRKSRFGALVTVAEAAKAAIAKLQ